jgi:hypothetical protein
VALRAERPVVTRCVKLNNYWCIKSARWQGEIGQDEDGHVAFATPERAADAALMLLRRYYLAHERKSALDIVRRWAPAECRSVAAKLPTTLAVKGIANTLRARYLASRARLRMKVAAANRAPIASRALAARATASPPSALAARSAPARLRTSILPVKPLPMLRAPTIAVGLGEPKPATVAPSAPKPIAAAPARKPANRQLMAVAPAMPVALPLRSDATLPAVPTPPISCVPDEQRIRNYASRVAKAVGLQPGDDLKLFDAEGRPQPNLARVMLSMSGFELGWLRADADLVGQAIARAVERHAAAVMAARDAVESGLPPAP